MSEFNAIHDPETGERFSIFSSQGRNLLKMYLLTYKSAGEGPFSIPSKQNDNSSSSVGQPQKTQTEGPFSLEPSRERAEQEKKIAEQIKQNKLDWKAFEIKKREEEIAYKHNREFMDKVKARGDKVKARGEELRKRATDDNTRQEATKVVAAGGKD